MLRLLKYLGCGLLVLTLVTALGIAGFATYNRVSRPGPEDNPDRQMRDEAVAYAEKGDARRSLVFATRIQFTPHNNYRDDAIKSVISALVRNGQDAEVLEFALSRQKSGEADSLLIDLAVSQAWQKQNDAAVATLQNVATAHDRSVGKGRVAEVIALSGKMGEALALARSIERTESRTFALIGIALVLSAQGDRITAREIIDEVLVIARSVTEAQSSSWRLSEVASSLAKIGDVKAALDLALTLPDGRQRSYVLAEIVGLQAASGKFEEARKIAMYIADDDSRLRALVAIMKARINAGNLSRAVASAGEGITELERDKVLAFTSLDLLHRYNPEISTAKIVNRSLAVAEAIGDHGWRDMAMNCIANYGFANIDLWPALKATFAIEDDERRKETARDGWRALLYGFDVCAPIS